MTLIQQFGLQLFLTPGHTTYMRTDQHRKCITYGVWADLVAWMGYKLL